MSEIVKSEYNALDEDNNYKTHYFKTSADQVVGLGRMKNTEYQVDDVVYSDTNNKVALKCTTSGTTSNTELDISTKNIGNTVTDGSVVWQVCNRTSDVTSINGKIGDVVVGEIVDAGINGKEITLTFADGTTKTLTTQDTNTNNISAQSLNENGYIQFDNGLLMQWGKQLRTASGVSLTVTFPKAFSTAYTVVAENYTTSTASSGTASGMAIRNITNTSVEFRTPSLSTQFGFSWVAFGKA